MLYDKIIDKIKQGAKQFVVLIDPEKATRSQLQRLLIDVDGMVDMIFLGGSTSSGPSDASLSMIREYSDKEVLLFPGNVSQITKGVDAVLFLSLLSGRNPDYLIANHVKAAPLLKDVEVIPVAYILVNGGKQSATELVSQTTPLDTCNVSEIVNTAIAGEMLGHKMVYLEAGSGALQPVSPEVIAQVKSEITIPLIVGGGITSACAVQSAYEAGADIVVVGNALESGDKNVSDFV